MWQDLIPACFGIEDLIFGGQFLDRERAIVMITSALRANANMDSILKEAEDFLQESNATNEHIEEQLNRIRNLNF